MESNRLDEMGNEVRRTKKSNVWIIIGEQRYSTELRLSLEHFLLLGQGFSSSLPKIAIPRGLHIYWNIVFSVVRNCVQF